MKPIGFLDTETNSLAEGRRAWEIAMVRRDDTGDRALHIFVDVADLLLEQADPAALEVGRFYRRHPQFGGTLPDGAVLRSEPEAVELVDEWTTGVEIYGLNPLFDTDCLAGAMRRCGREPGWWRTPVDMAVLARGFVLGQRISSVPHRGTERLSAQCGVAIPGHTERHTAMGDVRWLVEWYDHMVAAAAA